MTSHFPFDGHPRRSLSRRARARHPLAIGLAAAGLLAALAGPASARTCNDLEFRLWQKKGVSWYGPNEKITIRSGEEGHIYLHVRNPNGGHYSLSANIGYPHNFGLDGDARRVREHVRMEAQSNEDKRMGRIRLHAEKPGVTWLGYRVTGGNQGNKTKTLPAKCNTGPIRIEVLGRGGGNGGGGGDDGRPGDGQGTARAAAVDLVELLYDGLLRRPRHGGDSEAFVDQVYRDVRSGSLYVASEMLKSDEFRYEALRRTESRHGRRSNDELQRLLLDDIYRDLYGRETPPRNEYEEDRRDLEDCLNSRRGGRDACERLGNNLVGNRLFYEEHGDLIDAIDDGDRRNRRRGRR